MKLFHRKYGESGIPLIIVHGLYGSGDNWAGIARELAADYEVYVPDQRNHGQSPHSEQHDYHALRDDLKMMMDAEGIDEAILLGHSMGAKTCMFFAETWPDRVRALVSVDMAPRSYHDLAVESPSAANHAKMIDAMLSLDLGKYRTREEADRALRTSIGSERVRTFLLKNLKREKNGQLSWRLNLPALKNNLDRILDGMDVDEISSRGGIKGFPVLFISGEKSDYIRTEDLPLIHSVFPQAEHVSISGAGHWVHAEQPKLLLKNLRYFLRT